MSFKLPIGTDIFERVASTFVQGAVGVAIADQFGLVELTSTEWWTAVATGGVVAVLSLVKSVIATRLGKRSASLAPSVELKATSQVE